MKAAVVREAGHPPQFGDFEDPIARPGETIVSVRAAAVSHVVLSRASARHYSAGETLPFVPGVDGVGTTPDGRRVYFTLPRAPFGALAERVPSVADRMVALPPELDSVQAAASAVPGMSCWIPLTIHAPIRPDESVLINGATGTSGRTAVQVAKHLGARHVIATGRTESKLAGLRRLGADVLLSLAQPSEALREEVRKLARELAIGVVLDYLWGPPAETILSALGGPGAPRGPARIRFVQIGQLAGDRVPIEGGLLRSSGVEIVGSGIGSSPDTELLRGIEQFFRAFVSGHFEIDLETHPLADVERTWPRIPGEKRLVYTIG